MILRVKKILVVDDEAYQRDLFRRLFRAEGWSVVEAECGDEALGLLARPGVRPDLIICDIMMPKRDGVEILQCIRETPGLASIPAILATGARLPAGLLALAGRALAAGPVFIKGTNPEPLVRRIRELLGNPGASRVHVAPMKRSIWIDGRKLPRLAPRRFQLLSALLASRRRMSREELLTGIWDESDNPNVVDVTVLRLRTDLRKIPNLRIVTTPAGYEALLDPYFPD